ncbi:unnamed protein product [Effrenium voratum]|nr:unnamed protein product [Effrenium voratum]
MVNKSLKKAKQGGKIVQGENDSTMPKSPKSPKASPKVTPVTEDVPKPANEAKAKGKEKAKKGTPPNPPKQGKAEPRPPPTEKERAEATKKAIALIKEGLLTNPKEQEKGNPYIPDGWAKEWKPLLGSYRKFVETCSCFRIEQGMQPAMYTIHLVDGATDTQKAFWEISLEKAWQLFSKNHEARRMSREALGTASLCHLDSTKFVAAAKAMTQKPVPAEKPAGEKRKAEAEAKTPSKKKAKAAKKGKKAAGEDEE